MLRPMKEEVMDVPQHPARGSRVVIRISVLR